MQEESGAACERTIIEHAGEAFLILDAEGFVIYASPSCSPLLGWKPETLAESRLDRRLSRGDSAAFEEALISCRRTERPGVLTFSLDRGQGQPVLFEASIGPFRNPAGLANVVLSVRKLVGRRESDGALGLFTSAMDQVDESVLLTNRDGLILYVNSAFEKMTGFSREEAVGLTPRILKSGSHDTAYYTAMWKTLLAGKSHHGVTINRRKDGALYHEEKTITPVKDREGTATHFISTGRDVTGRQIAEERLRQGAERYFLSMRGTNDGLWDWDLRSGRVFLSKKWKTMLGYEENEIPDEPEAWMAIAHPDDAAELKTHLQAHILGTTTRVEWEHRVRRKDGTYAWVLTRGQAVRDAEGRAYRLAGSMTDISARKSVEAQLQHGALHDPLTGLPNRTLFMDRLGVACNRARRFGAKAFALMFLDLDKFKLINDSMGHLAGDQVLKDVAGRLRNCLRSSDTVARLGGDEFAILLDDVEAESEAAIFAERILQSLKTPVSCGGREVRVSGSIGLVMFGKGCGEPQVLMRNADAAMYHAKELGRARYTLFDGTMAAQSEEIEALEADLRRALNEGKLTAHFQPVISLSTGRVCAFEALARWYHAERGFVPPSTFLPVAEKKGFLYPLGLQILYEAFRSWKTVTAGRDGAPVPLLFANLSGDQMLRPEFPEDLRLMAREFGLKLADIRLEIAEPMLAIHYEAALDMLDRLHQEGVRFLLDDFGLGYPSITHLKRYPIDGIKLDKSLVAGLSGDPATREVVRAVISLARGLGVEAVAEGVETAEQARILRGFDCPMAQGFFFSHPVAASEASDLMDKTWDIGPQGSPLIGDRLIR